MNTATFIFDGYEEIMSLMDAERRFYAFVSQGYNYVVTRSSKRTIFEVYSA
jgi:hypothetical protein